MNQDPIRHRLLTNTELSSITPFPADFHSNSRDQHQNSTNPRLRAILEAQMASATGIPENVNGVRGARGASEEEPLLGRRGDASQLEGENLIKNLWKGECFAV